MVYHRRGRITKAGCRYYYQVNGKLRGRIQAPPGVSKDDLILRARELENVEKFLRKEKITRSIHEPDKLLNFVIS